jgi:hypothetical protein
MELRATSPWFVRQPQRGRCGSSEQIVVVHYSMGEVSSEAILQTDGFVGGERPHPVGFSFRNACLAR